jgi:hypothetical protein
MYLDRRQIGEIGIQQAEPGVHGVVITDIQRDSAFGRLRIQRLAPGTRVDNAGPV